MPSVTASRPLTGAQTALWRASNAPCNSTRIHLSNGTKTVKDGIMPLVSKMKSAQTATGSPSQHRHCLSNCHKSQYHPYHKNLRAASAIIRLSLLSVLIGHLTAANVFRTFRTSSSTIVAGRNFVCISILRYGRQLVTIFRPNNRDLHSSSTANMFNRRAIYCKGSDQGQPQPCNHGKSDFASIIRIVIREGTLLVRTGRGEIGRIGRIGKAENWGSVGYSVGGAIQQSYKACGLAKRPAL